MVDRTKMRNDRRRIRAEEQMAKAREKLESAKRAMKDAKAIEAHRNHHLYALGAEWYRLNLRAEHAPALAALWSRPLPIFIETLQSASDAFPANSVGEFVAEYVLHESVELTLEGHRIILLREVMAYLGNCEAWLRRQSDPRARQDWRANKVTTPQIWLIERTCELLELPDRPSLANCGEAHDWLWQTRANLRLNLASVNQSLGLKAQPEPTSGESTEDGATPPISATTPEEMANLQPSDLGLLPLAGESDHA